MTVLFGDSARGKLLQGIKLAIDPLLPIFGTPVRGYAVINSVHTSDPTLSGGLFLIQELAEQMHKECGDGVKLAALLFYKLAEHSLKEIPGVIEALQKQVRPIVRKDTLYIPSGLIAPYFTQELVWENVSIVVFPKVLSNPYELIPHLSKKPLLIIAPNIQGDALATLATTPMVCPIKSDRSEELQSITFAETVRVGKHSTTLFCKGKQMPDEVIITAPNALFFASPLLSWPLEVLLINHNLSPSSIMQEMRHKGFPYGINLTTGLVEDLFVHEVLDPAKTVLTAVEFAVQATQNFFAAETLIVES